MDMQEINSMHDSIRQKYAEVSRSAEGKFAYLTGRAGAEALGYPADIINEAPAELMESFCGVGNSLSLVKINPGEAVLDVGSGAGFDLFVANRLTGPSGHVCGIDITPEMIDKARKMLSIAGAANVEIKLGSSEEIPYNDNSFDVIISNGVINLSPDKDRSFAEIYRVLRPGGSLQFADIVSTAEPCQGDSCNIDAWSSWIAGAVPVGDLIGLLIKSGFVDVVHTGMTGVSTSDTTTGATFTARKPPKLS